MTDDDLTVGGLKAVLDEVVAQNRVDHDLIRERIRDLKEDLSKELADGFAALNQDLGQGTMTAKEIAKEHGQRLDALERWRWYLGGGFAVIIILISYLGYVIVPQYITDAEMIHDHLVLSSTTTTTPVH